MRLRGRLSLIFFVGVLMAGSTALGYYYYFFYEPPLATGEAFMRAMETQEVAALKRLLIVAPDPDIEELREPTDDEIQDLLKMPFRRGRILEQRTRAGGSRDYHYLVYREPDGTIYALLVTKVDETYRVVIPERRPNTKARYLWEYTWTN